MSSNNVKDPVEMLGPALEEGLALETGTSRGPPQPRAGNAGNGVPVPHSVLPNGTTSSPGSSDGHQDGGPAKLQPRQDNLTWDEYFMAVAFLSAQRSKDPVSQVGACIVNKRNQIVGIGYNGMPRGCHDKDMPWGKTNPDPKDNKYMYVCHAELNAILNKNSADVTGCAMYVALFPCNECAKLIIQAGITDIVYYSDKHKEKMHTIAAKMMLDMSKVKYRPFMYGRRKLTLDFNAVKAVYPVKTNGSDYIFENGTEMSVANDSPDMSTELPRTPDQYISWEVYFMAMAFLSAQRSKDPLSQVGACIVNTDKRIVAIGYNGMPCGCPDDSMPWQDSPDDTVNSKKYYVCHAELNAILNKNSADVRGCTMYVTLFPCNECAKLISQSGLKEVVYYATDDSTRDFRRAVNDILTRANVRVTQFNKENRTRIPIDFESIKKREPVVQP